MAAQGYIGRAPGESSVVVARQTFTPTGITTNFTFVSGYTVGYVDAYLNGVRLIEGSDYTATDGSIVGLSTNAINGDVLELVAYKAFNVSNVTGANGDFSVPDKIIHANDTDTAIRFPQADTFTVETAGSEVIRIDANGNVGIGTTNTLRVADPKNQSGLNVGFITANSITAAAGSFGSLNVSGTLTYEDVANQDVVGFSTFRKGINVQGAGSTTTTLNVTGVTTMTGDVNIAAAFNIPDAITHVGDTNTKIRFPAADTFTVETAGSERLRIGSSGQIIKGNSGTQVTVGNGANTQLIGSGSADSSLALIRQAAGGGEFYFAAGTSGTNIGNNNGLGFIKFMGYHTNGYDEYARIESYVDGTNGDGDAPGRLVFKTTADGASSGTERLRITSAGLVRVPDNGKFTAGAGDDLQIYHNGTDSYVQDAGTGSLILSSSRVIVKNAADNEKMIDATENGAVELYHDNVLKLETESGGVAIHEDTDKVVRFTGGISEIGSVPGFQATNTAGSALTSFGIRATDIRFATGSAERLRISSGGRLLINTTTSRIVEDSVGNGPQGKIQIEATNSDAIMSIISAGTADANRCGTINLGRHRNSTVGATPTVVNSGDALGSIVFSGGDGTDMRTRGATIIASCDGTPGENDMPTRLVFGTNAGSGSVTERLRIDSRGSFLFSNGFLAETVRINTTARTGTQAVYLNAGNVHYFTSSATGTWKPNFTLSTTPDINDTISTGDTFSVTMIVNKQSTSHYADTIQVDGSDVTPEWLGGAPTEGGDNNTFDVYSYTIIKTGDNAFKCFASVSNYT